VPVDTLPAGPWRVLVLGGARSGKSFLAERRVADEATVTYVATADELPDDAEWTERIERHRARRPAHWHTLETRDLARVLLESRPGDPVLLVDCVTLWLAADYDDQTRVEDLVAAWSATQARVVAVSNEVGSGVVPSTPSGRAFRDALGALNARLAGDSDEVWLVTAGIGQRLR
jgi:adenosylcobinamide kinase/adenosylcobinamide-phosphate guanylyltransferase